MGGFSPGPLFVSAVTPSPTKDPGTVPRSHTACTFSPETRLCLPNP
jgi:hypothetical protein